MPKEYLLDTNAYYELLKRSREQQKDNTVFSSEIHTLVNSRLFISTITKVEIISVLGKYARGSSGGFQRCTRSLSAAGAPCQNQWYTKPRARWDRKRVNGWQRLIKETIAATAQGVIEAGRDMIVVTSDKGLKACLSKAGIACRDVFQAGAAVVS